MIEFNSDDSFTPIISITALKQFIIKNRKNLSFFF